jgi:hypothetical protein
MLIGFQWSASQFFTQWLTNRSITLIFPCVRGAGGSKMEA